MSFTRSLCAFAFPSITASAFLLAQTTGISDQAAPKRGPETRDVPYTLTRATTVIQKLASGATISRTFTVKLARDSEGRVYSEQHQSFPVGPDRQSIDVAHYSIFDPIKRVYVNWSDREKVANEMHMSSSEIEKRSTSLVETPDSEASRRMKGSNSRQVTNEDLGSRTIAGIEAKGLRTTGVIPAGELGNDKPLTIVTENWISVQYNVPLLTITEDPRTGQRTDKVIDFHPGEPSSALFQLPGGYAIRESAAN